MTDKQRIYLPGRIAAVGTLSGSPVIQFGHAGGPIDCVVTPFAKRRIRGHLIRRDDGTEILVLPRKTSAVDLPAAVLLSHNGALPGEPDIEIKWLRPKPVTLRGELIEDGKRRCKAVLESWVGQFTFLEEKREADQVVVPGLRPPQLGALFAVLAHWKSCAEPCTVVMPTGTGKTETMLALMVKEQLQKLLVVAPTDTLREQIAAKFQVLGVLKNYGVIGAGAQLPVVGILKKRLKSPKEVDEYFSRCNVVVTTMAVAGGSEPAVQVAMARACSHLFIDEAHHIVARTWSAFRRVFTDKPIVQFTATPYRGDGRHVDGRIVFSYPVRKAQEHGYFRTVNFLPVTEFLPERADAVIASNAVAQLKKDLAAGLNHIVMARTNNTARAHEVMKHYEALAPEYGPVIVHSGIGRAQRDQALRKLKHGDSRVLVCVNMFGEGFDLPELKIAAMHDIHKGLAITIQFTGRFTRARTDIGDASLIANIADADVDDSLQELYAEGANWNSLLRDLSQGATGKQVKQNHFFSGFDDPPPDVPLQSVFPKMSTVAFQTKCHRWKPSNLGAAIKEHRLFAGPSVNGKRNVLFFVTREQAPIEWGIVRELRDTTYDLYLAHWDPKTKLLFIHSSNKSTMHENIAKALCGEDVDLIRGERMFRVFYGLSRLIPLNLGLRHVLERAVQFTMHMGSNIRDGLTQAQLQNKTKSNLFGKGFEDGDKATVGCSHRGRVWSYKVADSIDHWVDWCHQMGEKLLNDKISVGEVLKGVMLPETVTQRPPLVPLVIEWPDEFYDRGEEAIYLECAGQKTMLLEAEIALVEQSAEGPIRFRIAGEGWAAEFEMQFNVGRIEYVTSDKSEVTLKMGRRRAPLAEWFTDLPPVIRFENGAFLQHDQLYQALPGKRDPFPRERIDVWDWSSVDVRKESQTQAKHPDSIQFRTIQTVCNDAHEPRFDIVFDDDDKGEIADVVALAAIGDRLVVHLYHCKYAKSAEGARVKDLYEVCGQAQKSVFWKGEVDKLFDHLKARETARIRKGGVTRFERGDMARLAELDRRSRYLVPEFRVVIVQPGLSRTEATISQQDLLATTELYLRETYGVPLSVVGRQ